MEFRLLGVLDGQKGVIYTTHHFPFKHMDSGWDGMWVE